VQLPGVGFTAGCGAAIVFADVVNATFGPTLSMSTPNYAGGLKWQISSVTPLDVSCQISLATGTFSVSILSTLTAQLRVGMTPVTLALCPNGFTLGVTASRATDASQNATCSVPVSGECSYHVLGCVSCLLPNSVCICLVACFATLSIVSYFYFSLLSLIVKHYLCLYCGMSFSREFELPSYILYSSAVCVSLLCNL
jgi:hypothetical protein